MMGGASASEWVGSPAPVRLRVEDHPVRTDGERRTRLVPVAGSKRPRLSWALPLVRMGQRQAAYEVSIIDGPATADSWSDPSCIWWSSGWVESESCVGIRPGRDLPAYRRWQWAVRVRDERGEASVWSVPAELETGPLHTHNWHASWVSAASGSTVIGRAACPELVRRARLYISAQGMYRAFINGVEVNPGSAEPSRTDAVRALARCYDVTDVIRPEESPGVVDIAVVLASSHWAASGHDPRLLAELVLGEGADQIRYGTGAGWLIKPSLISHEEAFYLEQHDLRRNPVGSGPVIGQVTKLAEADQAASSGVPELPHRVEIDPAPELHVVEEWLAIELRRPAVGVRVYDVGVNIAGRARVELASALPTGQTITLLHGELLGGNGRVDTGNLSMPYDRDRERQCFELICSGRAGEVAEPWFAFYGFRYVEVRGLPEDAEVRITARVLHSDLPSCTDFCCDDPVVESLVVAAQRTQLNNMHGIPEDCPTREQSGWTGDAAATADLALAQFDMAGFYRKWLGDLATSQGEDGSMPGIAPSLSEGETASDPVWGSAYQRVLDGHFQHYGDLDLVREHLPRLRRWADYQWELIEDGVVRNAAISYGHDWLALEQTPPELLHTGAAIDCLDTLARLEDAAGDEHLAEHRRGQAAELRASARAVFHEQSADRWANGSQASYAVALVAGLGRPEEAEQIGAALAADIRRRGNRASTGFGATATLVEALSRTDLDQIVHDIIHQSDPPGVGAMLGYGLGTFWESWWIDPDNHGTGSLDHVGLGGPFATWVWRRLVGLSPTRPGFRDFRVAPRPVDGVHQLGARTRTQFGDIVVKWECQDGRLSIGVTVPVGTTAEVNLPGDPTKHRLGPGWHRIEGSYSPPASVPAVLLPTWSPPSISPAPADVGGGRDWLSSAMHTGSWSKADSVSALTILAGPLTCIPVHHAELDGSLLLVTVEPGLATGGEHTVSLRLDPNEDRAGARFVYAEIDLCRPHPASVPELVLRLHTVGGAMIETRRRPWPAGWNRIAVDLDGSAGQSKICSVDVGVHFYSVAGQLDPMFNVNEESASFVIGRIGWSASRRTW